MLSQDRLTSSERRNQEKVTKSIPTATPTKATVTTHKSLPEKIGEAAKGVSEVAEKTSTTTKGAAVAIGIGSAILEYPPGIAAAVDLYKGAMIVGTVGEAAEGVSLSIQEGKGTEAALQFGTILAGEVTGGWIDDIPGVSDVTKITAKMAAEVALGTVKEETKEELEKH